MMHRTCTCTVRTRTDALYLYLYRTDPDLPRMPTACACTAPCLPHPALRGTALAPACLPVCVVRQSVQHVGGGKVSHVNRLSTEQEQRVFVGG